jgi:hypothetical protein
MLRKQAALLCASLLLVTFIVSFSATTAGWSNGGYSADPEHPDYGTHDWIAEHALDWLPLEEKQFLLDNKAAYLYGTELPDSNQASDGVGDTTKHHVYYFANGSVQDDASAVRATEEYMNAVNFYNAGNFGEAAKRLGMVTHYIADMAVFGHVMGASTEWGAEVHHSDYENYVQTRTNSYVDDFDIFLVFDGSLDSVSAYDAALTLADDTTFDAGAQYTCVWMDQNYDWSDAEFKNRSGESLNLAVNLVADVLHTFRSEAVISSPSPSTSPTPSVPPNVSPTPTPEIPELPSWLTLAIFMALTMSMIFYFKRTKNLKKNRST